METMAKPIYKLFYGKPSPQWLQLSPEEQDEFMAKTNAELEAVGGKVTLILYTGWSSDKWHYAGVEEYPDIEAVQKYHATLTAMKWHQYFDGDSLLGVQQDND